jgi:hypothetical protein
MGYMENCVSWDERERLFMGLCKPGFIIEYYGLKLGMLDRVW